MNNEIENILEAAIADFNSKWQSHSDKSHGIQEYAKEIVAVFNGHNKELLKLVSDQNHLKDLLDDSYEIILSRDNEIKELHDKISLLEQMAYGHHDDDGHFLY